MSLITLKSHIKVAHKVGHLAISNICRHQEVGRLRQEAEHFGLLGMVGQLGEAGGRLCPDGGFLDYSQRLIFVKVVLTK